MLRPEKRYFTPFSSSERKYLVEWLFTQQRCLKLKISTVFLAVRILDNYTSNQAKPPKNLKVLLATILVIACKYEEVFSSLITFRDLEKEFKIPIIFFFRLEKSILKRLGYSLGFSIAPFYLWNLGNTTNTSHLVMRYALLLLCSSLMDPSSSEYLPSELACASLDVARGIDHKWTFEDYKITGYNSFDFSDTTFLVRNLQPSMSHLYRRFKRDQLQFD